ncbi:MAG TPA: MmgE/PrpD family protein, partial [Candidatus Methylomirabilis sp.]|nr:MmgE/PrpD family protein [Candidatus Methylomirabilis sp.]
SRKVEVIEDPAITAKGAKYRHLVRVRIRLKNGTILEQEMEAARGSEKNFASADQVIRKFLTLAKHALPEAAARELCDAVLNLESLDDAAVLPRLLSTVE